MSPACLLLLLMICGCWPLPLPSTTVVWSVLNNGQNQVNLLCLVNSRPDAAITVWIPNSNETIKRASDGIQMNIMPALHTQQYFFLSQSDRSLVFGVPPHGAPFSLISTENVGFHFSISLSTKELHINMPHFMTISVSSKNSVTNFIPSPSHHSGLILQAVFIENNIGSLNSNSKQDLNVYTGQPLLIGNLDNFAYLSLVKNSQLWSSATTCFSAETTSDDINDNTLSGELNHSLCYDEDLSMALADRMKQDFFLILAIRIVLFKLLIFDLLLTWKAMLKTHRLRTLSPGYK